MLNVFIETSGKAHPNDKGPFIVVAVMIQNENLEKLKFGIHELKLLSIGPYGVYSRIKTNDIVHGNGILSRFTVEKRSELLDRMMKIIEMSDVKIVYSAIKNKTSAKKNLAETTLFNEEIALRELIPRVYFASRHFSDSEIRFTVDSSQWDHDRRLSEGVIRLIFDLYKQMELLGISNDYNVGQTILSTSRVEPFIEIVNLIAYIVRNNYYRIRHEYKYSFTKYYRTIQSKIYKGFDEGDPKAGIFEL